MFYSVPGVAGGDVAAGVVDVVGVEPESVTEYQTSANTTTMATRITSTLLACIGVPSLFLGGAG